MRLAIFGTGYVGLVSGACLAQSGNTVTCVDIDHKKIEYIKKGHCPIYEPGLEDLIKKNVEARRLFFTSDAKKAILENDILVSAVGTPPLPSGDADLSYVFDVARAIGETMDRPKIVVQKSTVPVGTGKRVEKIIAEELKKRKKKIRFSVASNPEFLKEGSAVDDFMKPDRVIIGADDKKTINELEKMYLPFMRKGYQVIMMDRASAELTKYAANSMLATRISFINAMARLAEEVGADIQKIREGIGSDSRIGKAFLYASIGYGGSCFPKDVKALIATMNENNIDAGIFESVEKVNKEQKEWFLEKILKQYKNDVSGKKIAVWGLAFKAETDDVRDAAALFFAEELAKRGASLQLFDPEAMKTFEKSFGKNNAVKYAGNEYEAARDADMLVILTEWMQFRDPDFLRLKKAMKHPVIFDGRNLYDPRELKDAGFKYFSIGRAA
ncbi:MAG: UDP-glucose/GDP-mannose dehydrogenase family protein [Candidatus Moranbacteria bacterium]|nr:UDP-glucose/GDP-mannose dehydrogenase family protein [Candidatus Moranbacteria bacterium]